MRAVRVAHRDQLRSLLATAGAEAVRAAARRHRLEALARERLSALGDPSAGAPDRAAELRAMAFEGALRRVETALAGAGVRVLALKGPRLSLRLYGRGGLREFDDLDVLVAPEQLDAAVAVAGDLGWRAVDRGRDDGSPLWLHRALVDPGGSLPELEIHWRLHWYERDGAFARAMLEAAGAGDVPGALVPRPEHELAALLLFYARDGLAGLRWPADIAAAFDRDGDGDGGLEALTGLARAHPELAPAWAAALARAADLVGTPAAPGDSPLAAASRRARAARRVSHASLEAANAQIGAEVALVDVLLSPRPLVPGVVRRELTPPGPEVGSAPVHAVKMLARAVWALVCAARPRRLRTIEA